MRRSRARETPPLRVRPPQTAPRRRESLRGRRPVVGRAPGSDAGNETAALSSGAVNMYASAPTGRTTQRPTPMPSNTPLFRGQPPHPPFVTIGHANEYSDADA